MSLRTISTTVAAAAAGALALGGCGGGGDTRTVTQTVTVTVPARTTAPPRATPGTGTTAPRDPAAKKRAAFCASKAGDWLQQAAAEATKALNDRDVDAMLSAQRKAFAAAQDAPAGASCAVIALNSLRFSWNNGAQNFKGHDYGAEAEKVRRFQVRHELLGALPG